jgi:hypothetical protein
MAFDDLLSSPFQRAAIDQAATHGFTYWRPLAERFNISPAAANGVFGALKYKRLLGSFALFANTNGFRLTPFACRIFDIERAAARPRGEQAWLFRLARLVDCERRDIVPFTPKSLCEAYPELSDFQDMADRYVSGVRFELAVIYCDHGGSADRIVAKLNVIAARYLKHQQVRRLVWNGRLGVRVLTASVGKAEAITQRIERASQDPLIRIEIDVVEDLVQLLAGRLR